MRQPKKQREFSKIILAACIIIYIVSCIYGYFVIAIKVPEQVGELFAFVGAPTAVAIGFYSWKAKAENLLKIKGNKPETLNEIITESGEENGLTDINTDDNWGGNADSNDSVLDHQSEEQNKRVAIVRRVGGGKGTRR